MACNRSGYLTVLRCLVPGLALFSLWGCQPPTPQSPEGGSQGTAPQTGTTLKIGTLLPITGDLAQYGSPMQDSASLLVEEVNRCGGVQGQPVQLVTEDSQTDPARAAAAMTKLVEVDRVSGVVGAAASSESSVAVDIAVRNTVVQISPASTSPRFTERSKAGEFQGFWFRTAPSDALQGPALAQVAWNRGIRSVAVVAINNDYGNGWAASFIPAFKALGGTVTNGEAAIFYPPDGASFEAEVTKAFEEQPQGLVLIAYPETGSLVLKAAYEKGLLNGKTQILLTDGMKTEGIGDRVGKNQAGEYLLTGALGTAAKAGGVGLQAFTDRYQGAYNRSPEIYDPNTWDAAALLVLAAEAAKSTQSTALQPQIRAVSNAPGEEVSEVCQALTLLREGKEINYQGASGDLELDEWGDVPGQYDVWQIQKDGTLTIVETIAVGQ
jgi:ABC-type branched-subunit amino acid transport system substrate-binding protein